MVGKNKKLRYTEEKESDRLCLDLGAGKGQRTPPGFIPVDKNKVDGVMVVDLSSGQWPWKTSSVDEVHSDYLLNYLTAAGRVHFMNELYRVLKPEGKAIIIVPYWCSGKTYNDIRAEWPPIGEGFFALLSAEFRAAQNWVDDTGFKCNFDVTIGYGLHDLIRVRNQEYIANAAMFNKDAIVDLHLTLTKRVESK